MINPLILPGLPPLAALNFPLLYLLFGGGLVGALFLFMVAKIFGK